MARHFFIVGAQRSGTTWLYRMLVQHPDIAMAKPIRPEPKFFITDSLYEKGLEYYRKQYFPRGDYVWLGEKSTSYIEQPIAVCRIASHFSDAVIVFLLRDPIERALSNYRFSVENGLESLSLEQALARESGRDVHKTGISVSPYRYTARGHYVQFLDMWGRYFPRKQLVPLISERTLGSERVVRGLFEQLGLDTEASLREVDVAINETREIGTPVLPETRAWLREHFHKSNALLAECYGLDISLWQ